MLEIVHVARIFNSLCRFAAPHIFPDGIYMNLCYCETYKYVIYKLDTKYKNYLCRFYVNKNALSFRPLWLPRSDAYVSLLASAMYINVVCNCLFYTYIH